MISVFIRVFVATIFANNARMVFVFFRVFVATIFATNARMIVGIILYSWLF